MGCAVEGEICASVTPWQDVAPREHISTSLHCVFPQILINTHKMMVLLLNLESSDTAQVFRSSLYTNSVFAKTSMLGSKKMCLDIE